eukprot:maker-scaffold_53-snap-gene-1.11-mRNA-1 protein AED:0.19 eAED:0.19 QI:50/1/1/1/0/0.33/3/718/127
MEKYDVQDALGSGTYGVVSKATHRETGQVVALKRIKLEQQDEGIPSTTIREITLLRKLKHVNIIGLLEVINVDSTLVLVFELLDCDLRQYLDLNIRKKRKSTFLFFLNQHRSRSTSYTSGLFFIPAT